ncbi:MAG: chromosome segregation protein SMC [Methanotrichaceae archaeon]|nr:chromosome segregation protein SMC [Methanotrichaceae archaeon]
MYIKELELKNFKSFGKSVKVPLPNDFVTVTGPNGSGKSNIVDALLFALCLSNSRAMRAERLPDLIYRGDNGRNPDHAQVTVRLDNSARTLPLDQDIIEVSRKIRITGENKYASTYYFNGHLCTQGDLQDKLSKAGINPDSYNIVMQGDVTRIIEMTPTERRKIVDEIAGVAEFDEKKKKALEELEVVRERIGRVDVILEEVGAQLSRLKDERDRALSYQEHRTELRRQEAFLLLARLKEAQLTLSSLEAECRDLQARNERLLAQGQAKKGSLAALEEEMRSLSQEITHKGEEEQIRVKRRIEELKGESARQASAAEMAEKIIADAERQQKSCFIQSEKLQQEMEGLRERIRDASLRKASLQGELEDQTAELARAKEKISLAGAQYAQHHQDLEEARGLREEAKARLGDLIRERDRLLDVTRRGGLEKEELAAAIDQDSNLLASADHESLQLKEELSGLNSRAMEMERDREDLEGARLRLKREIAESERALQRLQGEYAKADARLRASEERSGYSRAVESIRSAIKRHMLEGLFGTVAELGKVDSRYSTALEVAAGARLQSIVADTDQDAAQAIDFLKRSQVGRATFLPLNKLDEGRLLARPQGAGIVDYALNLVKFDSKFQSAFWYVFRDTLVVENLSHARALMGRFRMVTLEGDLVERSGAMTGGHYKSRMKFAAEESQKLMQLSEEMSAAEMERKGHLDRLERAEGEISRISREVEELDKVISKKTFRLEELEAARPRLQKAVEERRERLAQMGTDSQGVKERLDGLEKEIASEDGTLQRCLSRIAEVERLLEGSEIPALTRQVEAREAEMKRLRERIMEIEAEALKDSLREESLSQKLQELGARREELAAERDSALEKKRQAEQAISELKSRLVECQEREVELESELLGLKGRRGELLDQILAHQREVDRLDREHERVEAQIAAAQAAAEKAGEEEKALRLEIEGCGVDPSLEPPTSETVLQKISSLQRAMSDLEPVNMLAIGEYDRVKSRNDHLQERRETLSREREAIIDKLDRYDQMKREAFLASFTEINKNFQAIFRRLSNGEGELILENPEDPLSAGMTIKARPAGKPFHRLESMSGGEKSLTALSFIFAIQVFRPAPFYAMDEIDMFLDGVNVERVARLIKDISAKAQFIVVSLRKPMIQQSKYTVGVTMQENNLSSVTGICTG